MIATLISRRTTFTGFTTAFAADLTPIKVGASSTPHAEILELVKDRLAEDGQRTLAMPRLLVVIGTAERLEGLVIALGDNLAFLDDFLAFLD